MAAAGPCKPTPNPQDNIGLSSVSCTTTDACTAVGFNDPPNVNATLAERWNGSGWMVEPTPTTANANDVTLTSVSCPSATACTAVGSAAGPAYQGQADVIDHWDGQTWTSQTPAGADPLEGVSCPTAGSCVAVGAGSPAPEIEAYSALPTSAPVLAGAQATGVTGTSAVLHSTVNPEGSTVTSCDFQWGTSAAVYTHTAPCPTQPGSGSVLVAESVTLTDLVPGTTYQYRVVAANAVGTTVGSDNLFATPASGGASTLGNASVGDEVSSFQSGLERVNPYALYWPGVARALSIYLQPTSTSGSQSLRLMIYADHDGLPGALLAQTSRVSFKSSDAGGWYRVALRHRVALADGTYWIGVLTGGRSGVAGWRYDDTGLRETRYTPFAGGPTNPFGATGYDTAVMSLYANLVPLAHQTAAMTRRARTAMLDHHAGQLGRRHGVRHSGRPR